MHRQKSGCQNSSNWVLIDPVLGWMSGTVSKFTCWLCDLHLVRIWTQFFPKFYFFWQHHGWHWSGIFDQLRSEPREITMLDIGPIAVQKKACLNPVLMDYWTSGVAQSLVMLTSELVFCAWSCKTINFFLLCKKFLWSLISKLPGMSFKCAGMCC